MKNLFKFLLSFLILLISIELKPAPFDTGMITITQPNDATFTGRIWGDEFFWWAETEEGYRFVQSGDGWYYYATLDEYGEFTKTTYKVGIDSPPASSYQLERTQARIDEINQQIEEFNEQIELNRQWFAEKQAEAQSQPVTLKVGIILIEFKDVKHYRDTILPTIRPDGYLTADFDSMMFSYNYWSGSDKHPENELVFGSFRDYWDQMSRGKLKITGKVVNPDNDEDGVPDWLEANHTRVYYADSVSDMSALAYETITKAIEDSLIDTTNTNSPKYYNKYAIVYAQNVIWAGALIVHAQNVGGKYLVLAERSSSNIYTGSNWGFTNIGIYGHEFGHTIGFYDEYNDSSETNLHNFCLMAHGLKNGPDSKAACPATLSPWYRIDKGWISQPELIDSDTVNFLVEYDYDEPKQFRINPVEATGEMHYLFEVKHREGFDSYIPEPPNTFQNQSGTLLIWQHNIESTYNGMPYYDRIRIKAADFTTTSSTQLNDFFPSDGYENFQCLNDTTLPAASLGDVYEEILPELIRPAHFALNGIQKLANDTTRLL
jgi:M6 family metalloprotease-like protein